MRPAAALILLALASCSSTPSGTSSTETQYPDPPDGGPVTWNGWVSGFSSFYCVSCHNPNAACGGSGCHTPADPGLYSLLFDMRDKSSWTNRSAIIQCGIAVTQDPLWNCSVTPETYPKMGDGNPMPTDHARGIIVDWIDAGCP